MATTWDDADCVLFDGVLQGVSAEVNSLSWSRDGSQLLSSSDDDSVLNCSLESTQDSWSVRLSYSRKHGAEQTKFIANSENLCLAISKFQRDYTSSARIWDIRENRFLKVINFKSKALRANGLIIHHEKPLFAITTLDHKVLLHQNEDSKPLASFICRPAKPTQPERWHRNFAPVAAFEKGTGATGFAIASDPQQIRLLDLRHPSKGELSILTLHAYLEPEDWIRTLTYTPITNNLLVTTMMGKMLLVDSFDGKLLRKYQAPSWTMTDSLLSSRSARPRSACSVSSLEYHTIGFGLPEIPLDESVIALGLWDARRLVGRVALWQFDSGRELPSFGVFHDIPNFVVFHPTRAQIAVGDVSTTSWRRKG